MYTYILLAKGRRLCSNGAKPYAMRVCSVLPYTQFLDLVPLVTPSHLPTALFANAYELEPRSPAGADCLAPPDSALFRMSQRWFLGVTSVRLEVRDLLLTKRVITADRCAQ